VGARRCAQEEAERRQEEEEAEREAAGEAGAGQKGKAEEGGEDAEEELEACPVPRRALGVIGAG